MVTHELLNNISHKDLRILTERSLDLGDNIPSILAFPNEFRQLQADFPICFCKDPDTGAFHCAAILGFEDEENLFNFAFRHNAKMSYYTYLHFKV